MQHFIYVDLVKAHVKAHFRRDPKTGKLLFIKDYDSKVHGKADLEFHQGHQVRVNNPRSKFHGQVMTVRHYSDKYNVVRLNIPGKNHTADFEPHQLEHHTPVAGSASPATPPPAKAMTLDDAKTALGLAGISFASAEMAHERKRVESMDAAKLKARISKIKESQKLYNFMRALMEWGTADKREVAKDIEKELIKRAEDKKAAAPAAKPVTKPPATPPAVAKITFDPGDRVRISNPRSKHHDKEGVVTSFSDKYNVVRLKLDDGSYTDVSPASAVNLSGNNQSAPAAQPAPEPEKTPEPPKAPEPPKTAADFPHDKAAAWKYASNDQRSLARVTGMVPLDDKAAEYIKKNLQKITAKAGTTNVPSSGYRASNDRWYGVKTRGGYTIPKYVNEYLNSDWRTTGDIMTAFRLDVKGDKPISDTAIGFIQRGKEDWEKAGYDYVKIEEDLKELGKLIEEAVSKETAKQQHSLLAVDFMLENLAHSLRIKNTGPDSHQVKPSEFMKTMMEKFTPDMKVSEFLDHYTKLNADDLLDLKSVKELFHAYAGPGFQGNPEHLTMRDVTDGLTRFMGRARKIAWTGSPADDIEMRGFLNVMKERSSAVRYLHEKFGVELATIIKDRGFSGDNDSMTSFIASGGVGAPPFARWSNFRVIEPGMVTYPQKKISDEILKRIKNSDILRDQWAANYVTVVGQANLTKNYNRPFKSRVFPRGLIQDQGPRAVGMKIARQSGKVDDIADSMSKRYWKEVEKQKKLKASGQKGADPADRSDPPPDYLGCTFKSVDDKTANFLRKKIEKAWDKDVHGGFFFKIHGIYQIGGMDHHGKYKKIEKDRDNVMYGYHSTNFQAAASIVKSSYRAGGGMLGDGVYVTDVSSKSAQYLLGNCNVTRRPGTRGVFLMNKVSLGKVHDKSYGAPNSNPHETPSLDKADTVFAPKNKMVPGYSTKVLNDEHAVKDANAVIPMYWVDLELTDRSGKTNP